MAEDECEAFLDAVQTALQQDRADSLDDPEGMLICLDAVFQCLVWVEPVFSASINFPNLFLPFLT